MTPEYMAMQRAKREAEAVRAAKIAALAAGEYAPVASFAGYGVEALDAALAHARVHLAEGRDPTDVIVARVRHATGHTVYALRVDAWELQHKRLTQQSTKQNGLLSQYAPRRANIHPKDRFK